MESLGILLARVARKETLTEQEILEIKVQSDRVNLVAPLAELIDPITETIDHLQVGNIRINRAGIFAGTGQWAVDFTGLRIAEDIDSTYSIAGYSTQAVQWGVTSSGKIVAGVSGSTVGVTLDTSGIRARAGQIGGWILTSNTLTGGGSTGVRFVSTTPMMLMGDATTFGTGAGLFIGLHNSTYKFRIGDPAGDNMTWNGSSIEITGGITADSGDIGGWSITSSSIESLAAGVGIRLNSTIPRIQVGDTAGVHIQIDGGNQRIRGSNFSSGMVGFSIDALTGNAEFNSIVARGEIRTAVFSFNQIQAYSGALGVFKGAGVLSTSIVVPATTGTTATLIVDNPTGSTSNIFSNNDIIRLKGLDGSSGVADSWFTVSETSVAADNDYKVTFRHGTAGTTFTKGQSAIDYGSTAGGGYLLMEPSQSTAGSTVAEGPFYSVRTFDSGADPWDSITEEIRLGNLTGFLDKSSEEYGIGIGATSNHLLYDSSGGFQMVAGDGNLVINSSGLKVEASETTAGQRSFEFVDSSNKLLANFSAVTNSTRSEVLFQFTSENKTEEGLQWTFQALPPLTTVRAGFEVRFGGGTTGKVMEFNKSSVDSTKWDFKVGYESGVGPHSYIGADTTNYSRRVNGDISSLHYAQLQHAGLATWLQIPHLRGLWAPDNGYIGTNTTNSVLDRSGQERHLSVLGTVTFAQYQNGNFPEIPYAEVTSAAGNTLQRTTETGINITNFLTAGGWFYRVGSTGNSDTFMGSWGANTTNAQWAIWRFGGNNFITMSGFIGSTSHDVTPDATGSSGTWQFVVIRFDTGTLTGFTGNSSGLFTTNLTGLSTALNTQSDNFRVFRRANGTYQAAARMGISFVSAAAIDDASIEHLFQATRDYYGA